MSIHSDDDIAAGAVGLLLTLVYFVGFTALEIWIIYQGCTGGMELWVALVIAASLLILLKFLYVLFLVAATAAAAIIAIPIVCFFGLFSK